MPSNPQIPFPHQMYNPTSSDFPFARSIAVKLTHHGGDDDDQPLLPGLPDHIAQLCLSLVPPSVLYSVCRSWRRLIYSQSFPPFLSLYAVAFPSVAASPPDTLPDPIEFRSFDPISRRWSHLPPPPSDPDPPRFLFRHPSFICRDMPVQSVSAAGTLVVLAATDDLFLPALPIPLVFDPLAGSWCCGPRIPAPRRWCVAGSAGGAVYVAGGVGANYSCGVARTAERWDLGLRPPPEAAPWRRLADLMNARFSRDAVEAVGWRGRLYMVCAKEGVVYDPAADRWGNMPAGMLAGWRGPAASMAEETIYMVDEVSGVLRRYDEERDAWRDVAASGLMRRAQKVAAGGGRVCVLCSGGEKIVVVDVVGTPPARMWVEDVPPGIQVAGIHILPRLVS